MLEDMDGKIDAIVDAGPCTVGVESTIVDLTTTPPRLLRPGGVTLEELRNVLGEVAVDEAVLRLMSTNEHPRAPGMKYRHYAPKAPVTVVSGDAQGTARYISAHLQPGDGVICFSDYVNFFSGFSTQAIGPADDPQEHARHIFEALRAFDHEAVKRIWAQSPDATGLGLAVTNRLNKAAGFHIISL
jgi:L-threonylcarbamoyladenylate synthase